MDCAAVRGRARGGGGAISRGQAARRRACDSPTRGDVYGTVRRGAGAGAWFSISWVGRAGAGFGTFTCAEAYLNAPLEAEANVGVFF